MNVKYGTPALAATELLIMIKLWRMSMISVVKF